MDAGLHRLVGLAGDDRDRRLDLAITRSLRRHRFLQRHQIIGIGDELARAQQQRRRGVLHETIRHGLRQEDAARAGLGNEIPHRQRDGIGEQPADHRRCDDLVVAADAAAPGMGHRRQHDETGDAAGMIERDPRAERTAPGMHHEHRAIDPELCQGRVDHARLDVRR